MLAFIDLEERVPSGHPLRSIKRLADEALTDLSGTFDQMYARDGRPSIPPERLLKASLLIALYSVRSERAFCEELDYSLLFRWFLDMDPIEPSFDPTVFTKNRERLLKHEVGQQLFDEVVGRAHARGLLSLAFTAATRLPIHAVDVISGDGSHIRLTDTVALAQEASELLGNVGRAQ
jgi:transposase